MSNNKLKIDSLEEIFNNRANPVWHVLNEYRKSQEVENEYIDFHDIIWTDEVENICKFLKDNEIRIITISGTMSNLLEILYLFKENGYQTTGLRLVYGYYTPIPAIILELND